MAQVLGIVFGFLSLFAAFAVLCHLKKLAPEGGGRSGRAYRRPRCKYGVDRYGYKFETWGR